MRVAALSLFVYLVTSIFLQKGLAEMKEVDQKLLETHLRNIVGERTPHLSDEHLANVFRYIKGALESYGYEIELDPFEFSAQQNGGQGEAYENIIARKKGEISDERIIIGAHFDSVPDSPGADDNASGVAVMLELARILAGREWNHMVEFIGFHMEEWKMIGSSAYVEKLKRQNIRVRGMISLEMVGFATNAPNSQQMPPGFGFFYPKVGNFIAVVGNTRSWKLMNDFKRKMKETQGLNVESLLMPFNGIFLPPTRWSDHSPFWEAGYPALLITDTSFYRNSHYHSPADTIETLNLDFMLKVTEGAAQALISLDGQ